MRKKTYQTIGALLFSSLLLYGCAGEARNVSGETSSASAVSSEGLEEASGTTGAAEGNGDRNNTGNTPDRGPGVEMTEVSLSQEGGGAEQAAQGGTVKNGGTEAQPESESAPLESAAVSQTEEAAAPAISPAAAGKPVPAQVLPDIDAAAQRTDYAEGFYYEPISASLWQRIYGLSYKEDCTIPYEDLRYLRVLYVDFEGETQTGELVCNRAIAQDLVEIFYELYQASYQIDQIRLVDEYDADDTLSCLDNNTSCFNYRVVSGSKNLSKHAMGLAIDINPFYNPYVTTRNGYLRISPEGSEAYADRSLDFPHKIDEDDLCYQLFTARGFIWGGHWKTMKDYQHFQKVIS